MPRIKDVLKNWYGEMSARFAQGPPMPPMAVIVAGYDRLFELLDDVRECPLAEAGAEFAPSLVGGLPLIRPSAIKLWVALKVLGDSSLVTRDQLVVRTGLSKRTLSGLFGELEALGWLSYRTSRGKGIWYKLHLPPAVLTPSAVTYFQEQIQREREQCEARWSDRTERIEESKGGSVTAEAISSLEVTMPDLRRK